MQMQRAAVHVSGIILSEKENTKKKLLLAARECILSSGHAHATIKRIADLAGVNHGLVHHYFGSKETLFYEVLIAESRLFDTNLDSITTENDMIRFLTDYLFMNARLIVEFQAMAIQMPEIQKAIAEIMQKRKLQLKERLNIKDPLDGEIIISSLIGLVIQHNINPDISKNQILKHLFKLFQFDFSHNKSFTEKQNHTPSS